MSLILFVLIVRLRERNGDLGKGTLEVYAVNVKKWQPACVQHWDKSTSPSIVCSMLGYSSVNSSHLTMRGKNSTIVLPKKTKRRMHQKNNTNLIKEFSSCTDENYPIVDLTCVNYGKFHCGVVINK